MSELPDEVYVITVDGEWPLTVVAHEAHAIEAHKRKAKEARSEGRVRVRRCRLEVVEEMDVVPPGRPKLVSKGTEEVARG